MQDGQRSSAAGRENVIAGMLREPIHGFPPWCTGLGNDSLWPPRVDAYLGSATGGAGYVFCSGWSGRRELWRLRGRGPAPVAPPRRRLQLASRVGARGRRFETAVAQ